MNNPMNSNQDPHIVVVGQNSPSEDGESEERSVAEMVEQPAKVMRIGSMIRQLLEEVRQAPFDQGARGRSRAGADRGAGAHLAAVHRHPDHPQ
jgi:hypothetical protein